MGGNAALLFLRVVEGLDVADVLAHMTAQGHCQCLDASTDAKDRQLAIVSQLGDEELGQVAFGINRAQLRPWLLVGIVRIVVGTTTQYQSVEML